MLTAVTYLGSVGLGVTSPQLFKADDGLVYVVKLKNNRLGLKVLVNELLACRFATLMDLCFPPGGIITITEELLTKTRRLRAARVEPGLHFASRYISGSRYVVKSNLHRATNKSQMAGVMLFDHMFHNLDRTWNRRNLIMHRNEDKAQIYAIDNSHLFKKGRWTVAWLAKLEPKIIMNYRRAYGWLLKHYLTANDFKDYIEKVRSITDEDIETIVSEIPLEWLPDDKERQALIHYIKARRDMIDKIARPFLELLTDEDGRPDSDESK
ncbi:MAG: HipA family kinase [Negativicutes bacterium]